MATKLVLFDCDSTLSAIEGIDELGRLRGPKVFQEIEGMTNAAMNGGTPMSRSRVTVAGASFVWSVLKTKWPVMAL